MFIFFLKLCMWGLCLAQSPPHVPLSATFFLPMQHSCAVLSPLLPEIYPAAQHRFMQEPPAAIPGITSLSHTGYSALTT